MILIWIKESDHGVFFSSDGDSNVELLFVSFDSFVKSERGDIFVVEGPHDVGLFFADDVVEHKMFSTGIQYFVLLNEIYILLFKIVLSK